MNHATCQKCGEGFEFPRGRGRPRKYCDGCRRVDPRRGRSGYVRKQRDVLDCVTCGAELTGSPLKRYCSTECKWVGREWLRVKCSECGGLTGRTVWAAPDGDAKCQTCSRSPCGTVAAYSRGCRCAECRSAKAEDMREYAARRKERDGISLYSQNRKYDGAHGHFIPKADRLAIYERDGWTCQLCGRPVDKDLHFNDRMAATLDHIEPQSLALIPDRSPENLRLAHRACNSRRNNEAVATDGSFRVRPDRRSAEDAA